jgi:hypothetical protein
MPKLSITTPAGLRGADHKAVIAWEALHARDPERGGFDDPPAARGAFLSLQAPGPTRLRSVEIFPNRCALAVRSAGEVG